MYIQTFTGEAVFIESPSPRQISVVDIAHALSQICRFVGHVTEFYSVADHSVNVMEYLRLKNYNRQTQLAGLLHDAAEAYLGDVSHPLKFFLPYFRTLEKNFDVVIQEALGIDTVEVDWKAISNADENFMVWEGQLLFNYTPLLGWDLKFESDSEPPAIITCNDPKDRFLRAYQELK